MPEPHNSALWSVDVPNASSFKSTPTVRLHDVLQNMSTFT